MILTGWMLPKQMDVIQISYHKLTRFRLSLQLLQEVVGREMMAMVTELTQVLAICEVNSSCTISASRQPELPCCDFSLGYSSLYGKTATRIYLILFYFPTGDEKYLAGVIVMAVLLVISTGYFICQNRRRKSLKKNPEKISKEGNNSMDEHVIPAEDEGNYEEVENEQSTYAALKKPGERDDDDDYEYTHLVDTQKIYVNQEESGF